MVSQPQLDGITLDASLRRLLGENAVSTTLADREFAATDVYRQGKLPELVIRPESAASLAKAVGLATRGGYQIVVRGGGASYSDGYAPISEHSVSVDMSALDRIVEIDEDNQTVTVQAGCTWSQLHETLQQRNLRTPFFGPFSGIAATVGGSISQHAVSHGTGRYGTSAESVLSIDVVLASGEILSTGSAALQTSDGRNRRHFRHNGPDLTGLFCGDCGAFGVKAAVTLPIIENPAGSEALAFTFPTFDALHEAMAAMAKLGVDDENFGLDIALQQGQIARNEAAAAKMKLAWQVLRSAPSVWRGIYSVIRMALAGSRHLREPGYSASYIVKGASDQAARASAAVLRDVALRFGKEVPNTIPRVVESMPFAPLYNVLGPGGERWVPIHGLLAHSDVSAFHERFNELLARYQNRADAAGVWTGTMFQAVGPSAFLYEIAFYWPDELTAYHHNTLDAQFLADVPRHAPNPAGAALVESMKHDAIELFAEFGAVHLQIGKAYPFKQRLTAEPAALLAALKKSLDPDGRMNPGALGLS